MKKILYLLAIIFLLSLVLSKHARTVFSDALGWYEYEVTHTFQRAQTNVNDTQFLIDEGFIPINNLAFAGMWGKKDYYTLNTSKEWVPMLHKEHPIIQHLQNGISGYLKDENIDSIMHTFHLSEWDDADSLVTNYMLTRQETMNTSFKRLEQLKKNPIINDLRFDSLLWKPIYYKNIVSLTGYDVPGHIDNKLKNNQISEDLNGWRWIKVPRYNKSEQHTEIWKSKSNKEEWHVYNPEEDKSGAKKGYRSDRKKDGTIKKWTDNRWKDIDTFIYPNKGYIESPEESSEDFYQYDMIENREIKLIKSPSIADVFTASKLLAQDNKTMNKFLIFGFLFCLTGYIMAMRKTKVDPDFIIIKGKWDYFWLATPYVFFIISILLDFEDSGLIFLFFISAIGLLIKSIMHNKGAENIFLSFISKIFVIIILALIIMVLFSGGKKDKRFKDGTKDNQATKNRVIAKGAAYSLILCLIHGSDAWKNEFQGKLK
jgi:hypothetical protein